jgi:trehalose/maltose hydrolase-like predicted phosphorylase
VRVVVTSELVTHAPESQSADPRRGSGAQVVVLSELAPGQGLSSQVGYPESALEYFLDACAVDLADAHGNTADGIHIASCGGTWLALVAGFGGLRDVDGEVRFHPRLPARWERLRFRVEVRGQLIEVDMTPGETNYSLVEGPGILIEHFGESLRLRPGAPIRRQCMEQPAQELPLAA